MAAALEDLQRRMDALEAEVRDLKRNARGQVSDRTPMDGTILECHAEIRRQNASRGTLAERRRALGIPEDMPRIGAKKLQELMLAEGVRPEDRLLSSEIIRLRDEERS